MRGQVNNILPKVQSHCTLVTPPLRVADEADQSRRAPVNGKTVSGDANNTSYALAAFPRL